MTCVDEWLGIIETITAKGESFIDNTGRSCVELLNTKIVFQNPQDFNKPMEKMIRQMEFIYPSIDQLQNLVLSKKGLKTNFSRRMLDYEGLNQLYDFIIPLLRKDPQTRRAVMSTYNPLKDSSLDDKTVISMMTFFFRIINKKLFITVFIRSLDCFLGLPANLVQAGTIQKEVAEKLKLEIGSITFFAGSAHIYEEYFKMINKVK